MPRLRILATLAVAVLVPAVTVAAPPERPAGRLGFHPDTGRLIFVGSQPGRPLAPAAADASQAPVERGLAFVRGYAEGLGLRDADAQLQAFRTAPRADGRTVVRYRQVHEGVPVFGADVVVNLTKDGSLLALSAKVSPDLAVSTEPKLSSADAANQAVAAIAKYHRVDAATLEAGAAALWVYDPRLIAPAVGRAALVYRVEVGNREAIREVVLVDARTGAIALHYNRVDTSWTKARTGADTSMVRVPPPSPQLLGSPLSSIYTMNHACDFSDSGPHCSSFASLPGTLVCTEANPSSCSAADAAAAYAYGVDTYEFYASAHGRDSIDGAGMRMKQTVQYGNSYQNAFWNGTQMVYGDGFSAADDVVGHELTHGVTDFSSELIYFGQPGAINESFSDIWGEFIDQVNGAGTDTTAVRWLMGEDVPGLGAIRNMKNPPAFGDPDRMTSAYYYIGPGDSYGVHINSGVNNKAAYLMVDGGVFNGKTVAPLGIAKVADIYYEAQTNLIGSGTNYIDLYYALRQACANLAGGPTGIVASDCDSVKNATDAVQMNKTRSAAVYPTADFCPLGQGPGPVDLFSDDLESGAANWQAGVITGSSPWAYDTLRTDSSSGSSSLVWSGASGVSDSYVRMASDVVIPVGQRPYLRFEHDMWGFDANGAYFWDGGVVEYSTNGGATWLDLAPKFAGGKNYGGMLQFTDNPLGGRKAFVGATVNYTASLYNLATLAGQNFRIRFRAASDGSVTSYPWYIDDVRIYTCIGVPRIPGLLAPGLNALVTDTTPRLDWSDSTPDLASYKLQVATDAGFTALVYDVSGLGVSEYTTGSLTPNTKYYWRVQAVNASGASLGWTPAKYFRVAITPPTPASPVGGGSVFSRRPTFDWNDVAGVSNYTIQIAASTGFGTVLKAGNTAPGVSTWVTPSDLPAAKLLYWRVRANGVNGPSLWSSVQSFTTGNPPSVPGPLSPANGVLLTDLTPRLDWGPSVVPAGTTFDRYVLEVANNTAFAGASSFNLYGVTSSEHTLTSALASGTTYYWRVRSYNSVGDASAWSAVRNFRTAP